MISRTTKRSTVNQEFLVELDIYADFDRLMNKNTLSNETGEANISTGRFLDHLKDITRRKIHAFEDSDNN